jgi:zinc transport system substrate-binding protein
MVLMHTATRALVLAAALSVTACGSPDTAASGSTSTARGELSVVASFYPLQFVAERIGGDAVDVASLTKAGAEPHDLELTPKDVASLADTDLVIYLKGFQPAVDEAVTGQAADRALDVTDAADLDLTYTPIEEGVEHADEAGATDPHFWLDPQRLRAVAKIVAERLTAAAPASSSVFAANLEKLDKDLATLDTDIDKGLATCASRVLVTSHNAFGYLSRRYDLKQVGITGLSPDAEPNAGQVAQVTRFVRQHKVRTIYYETLVSPAVADTIAADAGATTAVLDPLEGLNDQSQGKDYLSVMRANLANLRKGQECS